MSLAVGTKIRHLAGSHKGYKGLRAGWIGEVIPSAHDPLLNSFGKHDEFKVKFPELPSRWYFSEAEEGQTWERVEEDA